MPTIDQLKEQETPPTPLFLFDCVLASGVTVRWSTHTVTVGGNAYPARLLKHNLAALVASSDQGVDGAQKITVTLANADSYFSQIERETGFRGGRVTIQFVFYDLTANAAVSGTASDLSRNRKHGGGDYGIGVPCQFREPPQPAADCAAGGANPTAVSMVVSIDCTTEIGGVEWRTEREIFGIEPLRILPGSSRRRGKSGRSGTVHELRLHAYILRGARYVRH